MEPVLLVLLGSLWGCSGRPANKLTVVPAEPVVPYGGSAQLNCSLACAEGTVQWRGLDTNLGTVVSSAGHSVLRLSNTAVAAEGTKICQGTCGGRHYQHAVDLKVYSLPDTLQLAAQPAVLVPGRPAALRCAARRVYPLAGLALAWYRGERLLQRAPFDAEETEEELFDVAATLPLAGRDVVVGAEFRCEVTLTVRRETFTRAAALAVSDAAVTEQPAAAATVPQTPPTAPAPTGTPGTAASEAAATLPPTQSPPARDATAAPTEPSQEPAAEAASDRAAAAETPSPESPAPRDDDADAPTAPPATGTVPGSGTASPTAGSTARAQGPAADGAGRRRGSPTAGPAAGTAPGCSLRIWSLPPNGTRGRALRIECRAQCGANATVRWLRTPVALSQYREEAAGSGSALSLDRAELRHQGRYQCAVLSRRAPVASLQLAVSADTVSTDPAIPVGTTVSLLGLIVTAVTSHRLWKRFKSQYDLS